MMRTDLDSLDRFSRTHESVGGRQQRARFFRQCDVSLIGELPCCLLDPRPRLEILGPHLRSPPALRPFVGGIHDLVSRVSRHSLIRIGGVRMEGVKGLEDPGIREGFGAIGPQRRVGAKVDKVR